MEAQNNEILLIYNSEKSQDRKAKGYADSLKDHVLNERDVMQKTLTETQLAEIATDLHVPVQELIDENSDYYLTELKDKSFSDQELTKIMVNNPDVIKTPIAYIGSRAFFVGSSYDFVKQDLEIDGVKSDKGNIFEK